LHRVWMEPDLQISRSDSGMKLHADPRSAFLKIDYTWSIDGEAQEGSLLVCQADEGDAVEIAWVDSWHQSGGVMKLQGNASETGVHTKGAWEAGDQIWGWTVDIGAEGDSLKLTMDNITPDGEVSWAVRSEYRRA